ncbi:cyclic-phosphate processing receiver domain-containing protein [Rosistilla oblonga]|uniref:cyclic-phosphate processing receiver domain-containing protein n=1 Tax=Rosistilla oblonga TaxID=2527990 RepID=UPI0018D24BF6|nr:cyclic-phosphate processing receiver domain-containing protein [Rosistilla oblonga]
MMTNEDLSDDERAAPDGWRRVSWPDEVIELLKAGGVSAISLDHDLGDEDRGTGCDVVLWIEDQLQCTGLCLQR